MKKNTAAVLLFFACFQLCATPVDWGRNGHRATGQIAEKHLNKKAKRALKKILNGESLALVSTYADEIKSDDRYRAFGPWHYVNFPFGTTYAAHPKSEKGDIIKAIATCVSVLKNKNTTKGDMVFYLKLLVHFMGDLHQPLHVGLAEDKGGNSLQVRWFNEGTNLHTVWDTKMIESYNMSYSELAANTKKLSKPELEQIRAGTVLDWMYDSKALCKDVYTNTAKGEKLGYNYMYRYMATVCGQLQKGGIRLAVLLNEIFG